MEGDDRAWDRDLRSPMETQKAYDLWAAQYDTDRNRTRDLEAIALRETVADFAVSRCLEIGCGTGKNTEWLATHCGHVSAVDFSREMLALARKKVTSEKVRFVEADITQPWTFLDGTYDLITFSLVLEHVEDLEPVLEKAAKKLAPGGHVYIGELHPFKQYGGTKARFGTGHGVQEVNCFNHHVSDFMHAALKAGLAILHVKEYFDDDDRSVPPRLLVIALIQP